MTLLWGAILFAAGITLMLLSVEGLVTTVVTRATALGISGLALGALSTSLDPESTGAGLTAAFNGLPEIAIGTHVGSVIFIATLALGILAVAHPFEVQVDRFFLLAVGASTSLAVAVLISGELDRPMGALLLVTFGVLVWGAFKKLRPALSVVSAAPMSGTTRTNYPVGGVDDLAGEHVSGIQRMPRFVARIGVAIAGLIIGSELLIEGTKDLLQGLGWSATIFGSIVVAIAISLEEGLLELVPAHHGHPEISVGNVVGTIPFLLTGSLGLIGIIHPVAFEGSLRTFHAAALAIAVATALWALTRQRTGRREGVLLIATYGCYLAGSLLLG